jgi:hypothetical protein
MIGISLPESGPETIDDPLDAALSADSKVIFSMVAGEVLHGKHSFTRGM